MRQDFSDKRGLRQDMGEMLTYSALFRLRLHKHLTDPKRNDRLPAVFRCDNELSFIL